MADKSPASNYSIDDEINLFRCYREYKLAGIHKHIRMINVLNRYHELTKSTAITSDDIWSHLNKYYDLNEIDYQEDDLNEPAKQSFIIDASRSSTEKSMPRSSTKPSDSTTSTIAEKSGTSEEHGSTGKQLVTVKRKRPKQSSQAKRRKR